MLSLFLVISVICIFFISLYGWGAGLIRFIYKKNDEGFVYSAVLGIAVWIFLGGVLNMTRIAYPLMLDFIVISGWVFALLMIRERYSKKSEPVSEGIAGNVLSVKGSSNPESGYTILLVVFLYVSLYWISTLVPIQVYNTHDDFHKYIYLPYRMFATGFLGGDHFSLFGLDSMGGQAFLQSFVVNHFPIQYIGSFDAVFCFMLSGLLLLSISKMLEVHWVYALLAILALIFINPQLVNISAVYSSVLIMLGLVYATVILLGSANDKGLREQVFSVIPFSLFITSLVLLKSTYLLVAAIYLVSLLFYLILNKHNRKAYIRLFVIIMLVSTIIISPWLISHASNFFTALEIIINGDEYHYLSGYSPGDHIVSRIDYFLYLFSDKDLFWGGRPFGYSIILSFFLIVSLYYIFKSIFSAHTKNTIQYIAPVVSLFLAIFVSLLLLSSQADPDSVIRYCSPMVIVIMCCGVLLLSYKSMVPNVELLTTRISVKILLFLFVNVLVISAFFDSFVIRAGKANDLNTALSYPVREVYQQYNSHALSDEMKKEIRGIQEITEENSTVLTFISMPLHLDFKRNKVNILTETGNFAPWLNLPIANVNQDLKAYLKEYGVRYVIWEYKQSGMGMKNIEEFKRNLNSKYEFYNKHAVFNIRLLESLYNLRHENKIVYRDEKYVVFDLE